MKTLNAPMQPNLNIQTDASKGELPDIVASMRSIMALISAGLAAIAIITLFVWLTGTGFKMYFGAIAWGLGFVFLALAMENQGRAAKLQAVTGMALLAMALLQAIVSPDYIIGSGTMLAIWSAAVLYRRLTV